MVLCMVAKKAALQAVKGKVLLCVDNTRKVPDEYGTIYISLLQLPEYTTLPLTGIKYGAMAATFGDQSVLL